MTPIYLHIGTHKTGSTSIQHFLVRADEMLAEQELQAEPDGVRPLELEGSVDPVRN